MTYDHVGSSESEPVEVYGCGFHSWYGYEVVMYDHPMPECPECGRKAMKIVALPQGGQER